MDVGLWTFNAGGHGSSAPALSLFSACAKQMCRRHPAVRAALWCPPWAAGDTARHCPGEGRCPRTPSVRALSAPCCCLAVPPGVLPWAESRLNSFHPQRGRSKCVCMRVDVALAPTRCQHAASWPRMAHSAFGVVCLTRFSPQPLRHEAAPLIPNIVRSVAHFTEGRGGVAPPAMLAPAPHSEVLRLRGYGAVGHPCDSLHARFQFCFMWCFPYQGPSLSAHSLHMSLNPAFSALEISAFFVHFRPSTFEIWLCVSCIQALLLWLRVVFPDVRFFSSGAQVFLPCIEVFLPDRWCCYFRFEPCLEHMFFACLNNHRGDVLASSPSSGEL